MGFSLLSKLTDIFYGKESFFYSNYFFYLFNYDFLKNDNLFFIVPKWLAVLFYLIGWGESLNYDVDKMFLVYFKFT